MRSMSMLMETRAKMLCLLAALLVSNISVWLWCLYLFHDYPLMIGAAVLAYSFGLRHAVDADHIAAIDNVTRKLMQEGKKPVTAGLFFSLGHSTLVFLAVIGIIWTAKALQSQFAHFQEMGSIVGTLISAVFLFLIAVMNAVILYSIVKIFRQVRRKGILAEQDLQSCLQQQGLLMKPFRPLFRLISQSWHMYPLGFLFGLGFDSATEIGLLALSAGAVSQGLSLKALLIFPALFTAGMTLIDSVDNLLMIAAYGWAFMKPLRKLYYNMTITFISVVVALVVGSVETLGLLADKLSLNGPVWHLIKSLNQHSTYFGYFIIAIFVSSWLVSLGFYRFQRLDKVIVKKPTNKV